VNRRLLTMQTKQSTGVGHLLHRTYSVSRVSYWIIGAAHKSVGVSSLKNIFAAHMALTQARRLVERVGI
jgi:hypothetical protein